MHDEALPVSKAAVVAVTWMVRNSVRILTFRNHHVYMLYICLLELAPC